MEANSTVDLSTVVPPSPPAFSQSLSFSVFTPERDGTLSCQFYLPQNADLGKPQHSWIYDERVDECVLLTSFSSFFLKRDIC